MDLFSALESIAKPANVLPCEGEVFHLGSLYKFEEAAKIYNELLNTIPFKPDEVIIYGKHISTKRETAWFGDQEFEYKYAGILRKAKLWTPLLQEIKAKVEAESKQSFNTCLLNYYHNGQEGMSWHADDEPELGAEPCIASLSFGAARKFSFKHKTKNLKTDLLLQNGDLLLMQGQTQTHWKHALPKTTKVLEGRINLTFRMVLG